MNIIFDNLGATIIGGMVLLILLAMQQRIRNTASEQTMMYMTNKHAIELGTWMQEDMVNVGWQVSGGNGIVSLVQNDTLPQLTQWFEFDGLDASDITVSTRIQYQLIPVVESGDQVFTDINGASVPLWEIQRLVNGNVTGRSAPLITHFRVEPLDDAGTLVAPNLAGQIRVRFSMAMPYGDDSFIREVHWGTSFSIGLN